mgnify:CR=1 FL=1
MKNIIEILKLKGFEKTGEDSTTWEHPLLYGHTMEWDSYSPNKIRITKGIDIGPYSTEVSVDFTISKEEDIDFLLNNFTVFNTGGVSLINKYDGDK